MSTWDHTRGAARAADRVQVACFCVGPGHHALDILRVKEIVNPVPVAPVPGAPGFVEGVIDLRGAFVAVIDLRKRLGLEPTPITRDSKYIVALLGGQRVGLIVDRVLDVRWLARAEIQPVPALARGPASRCLAGMARWDEHVMTLIDLDAVLSEAEAEALQRMDV